MARNQTLVNVLRRYRAEIGASGNSAHNTQVEEAQVLNLVHTQEMLWAKHDWDHMRVWRGWELVADQRFYSVHADLSIDRLEEVWVYHGNEWVKLKHGIGIEQYAQFGADTEVRQSSWPVERWQVYRGSDNEDLIEFWPVPSQATNETTLEGKIRYIGIANLRNPADGDPFDLDSELIVLYAAAKELAKQDAKHQRFVLEQAIRLENSLVGNFTKVKQFRFGGTPPKTHQRRSPPRVHYREVD